MFCRVRYCGPNHHMEMVRNSGPYGEPEVIPANSRERGACRGCRGRRRLVGGAIGVEAYGRPHVSLDDWLGDTAARRLELECEPVEIFLPVLGPFAVARLLVVAGAAGEIGGQRMLGPRHRPVADAVAV